MRTLLVMAVLPAAVLLAYVYRIDPREKEPASLLGRLLLAGMASTVPAMVVEVALTAAMLRLMLRVFQARAQLRGVRMNPRAQLRLGKGEWALLIAGVALTALMYVADVVNMLA